MAFLLRLLGIVLLAAASMTGSLCFHHVTAWQQARPALDDAQFPELLALFGLTLLLAMGGLVGIAMSGVVADLERLRQRLADPYDEHPKMAPGAYDHLAYLPEL